MPSAVVTMDINVSVADLAQEIAHFSPSTNIVDKWMDNGNARWISCQGGGKVLSACYHRTMRHTATARTGVWPFIIEAKSDAPAGRWAVAWLESRVFDETFYHF